MSQQQIKILNDFDEIIKIVKLGGKVYCLNFDAKKMELVESLQIRDFIRKVNNGDEMFVKLYEDD